VDIDGLFIFDNIAILIHISIEFFMSLSNYLDYFNPGVYLPIEMEPAIEEELIVV
jgi:hypothetical protein